MTRMPHGTMREAVIDTDAIADKKKAAAESGETSVIGTEESG